MNQRFMDQNVLFGAIKDNIPFCFVGIPRQHAENLALAIREKFSVGFEMQFVDEVPEGSGILIGLLSPDPKELIYGEEHKQATLDFRIKTKSH